MQKSPGPLSFWRFIEVLALNHIDVGVAIQVCIFIELCAAVMFRNDTKQTGG